MLVKMSSARAVRGTASLPATPPGPLSGCQKVHECQGTSKVAHSRHGNFPPTSILPDPICPADSVTTTGKSYKSVNWWYSAHLPGQTPGQHVYGTTAQPRPGTRSAAPPTPEQHNVVAGWIVTGGLPLSFVRRFCEALLHVAGGHRRRSLREIFVVIQRHR